MKKNLIFVLLLSLCLVLAACGGEKDVAGKVETIGETAEVPVGTVAPVETLPPETTVPPTTVPETTAPPEREVSLGRMEGGVYTNEYVGYGCTLSADWTFKSAQELQEIPDNVAQILNGSEVGEIVQGLEQVMDMSADNVSEITTMNVLYQKLTLEERIAYAVMTEEEVIDGLLEIQSTLAAGYEQAGMTVISMEKKEVTFLGEPHYALYTQISVGDVPYYVLQLMHTNLGSYNVTTTVGSFVEDKTDSLLDLFYPLEK